MSDLNNKMDGIILKMQTILEDYMQLEKEYLDLIEERNILKQQIKDQTNNRNVLEEKIKFLEEQKSVPVSTGTDSQDLKAAVDDILLEVERCMGLLSH